MWLSLEMGVKKNKNTPLQTSRPNVRIWWSPCADVYFCCCRLLFRSLWLPELPLSLYQNWRKCYILPSILSSRDQHKVLRQRTTPHCKKDTWKDLWENRGKVIFPLSLTVSKILKNCFSIFDFHLIDALNQRILQVDWSFHEFNLIYDRI